MDMILGITARRFRVHTSRRPFFAALNAPLEPTQQAEVTEVIKRIFGPGALQLFQTQHNHFLEGVTQLYAREVRNCGHDHAQGVLRDKLQAFGKRCGIDVPAAAPGDALAVQVRRGPIAILS